MDYQEKIAKFDTSIEKAGLFPAYDKLNNIAEETLGTFLDDMIEQTVKEDCKPECRVRYIQNNEGEWYNFEIRQNEDDNFGLDTSFQLVDGRLNYQALTKIRELMKLGYRIYFT